MKKQEKPRLGKVSKDPTIIRMAGSRDAFHSPSILTVSNYQLSPGQRVRFSTRDLRLVVPAQLAGYSIGDTHGVVDPFLDKDVAPGTAFNVLLMPDTVVSLSHVFDVSFVADDDVVEKTMARFRGDNEEVTDEDRDDDHADDCTSNAC